VAAGRARRRGGRAAWRDGCAAPRHSAAADLATHGLTGGMLDAFVRSCIMVWLANILLRTMLYRSRLSRDVNGTFLLNSRGSRLCGLSLAERKRVNSDARPVSHVGALKSAVAAWAGLGQHSLFRLALCLLRRVPR